MSSGRAGPRFLDVLSLVVLLLGVFFLDPRSWRFVFGRFLGVLLLGGFSLNPRSWILVFGRFLGVLLLGVLFLNPRSWILVFERFLGVLFLDPRSWRFVLVPGRFPGRFVLRSSFLAFVLVLGAIGRYVADSWLY